MTDTKIENIIIKTIIFFIKYFLFREKQCIFVELFTKSTVYDSYKANSATYYTVGTG